MEKFFNNKNESRPQAAPAPTGQPLEASPVPGGVSAMLERLAITKPSQLQATLDKAVADGLLTVTEEPDQPYIDGK
jgi:hypothetical protein